jgi:hypothetical protein
VRSPPMRRFCVRPFCAASTHAQYRLLDRRPSVNTCPIAQNHDSIHAFGGGEHDSVNCGPGRDVAYVDRGERTKSCERVRHH